MNLLRQDGGSRERRNNWTRHETARHQLDVTSAAEFLQRRRSVRNACSRKNNLDGLGQVESVLTDDKSGLVYCLVPKAGCTYWKRLFESLHTQVSLGMSVFAQVGQSMTGISVYDRQVSL